MTQTTPTAGSHRFEKRGLTIMTPRGIIAPGSIVWNFEFGSLGFVWDLIFGDWNLKDAQQHR